VADARRLRDALAEAEAEAKPRRRQVESTEGNLMPKPSVNASKHDRQRDAAFTKGGDDRMFKKQAAGPAKAGQTGKNESAAPGAKATKGGPKSKAPGRALPAKGGRTGVR
jgi:hypothetical protein